MYAIKTTREFEKDVRRCVKRGLPIDELRKVMKLLERDGILPANYRPHKLTGDCRGQWECHIKPDWLLVWERHDDELVLLMLNTGTHADIFGKKRKR